MITLNNLDLKANQSKVMGLKDSWGEESTLTMMLKNYLTKLTLIIGDIEAGNTSIEMRNMGVSVLDTLLRTKAMNKGQYQKLVKKYFKV